MIEVKKLIDKKLKNFQSLMEHQLESHYSTTNIAHETGEEK